ncbi:HAD-IIA family hydrolase [Salipiger sp. PrR002]|uniref:HAD-IIA family hydrolase n=1 Tax=Salipiger sp. PrR002 TaxID=2706489 RepID=UPI0034CECAFD
MTQDMVHGAPIRRAMEARDLLNGAERILCDLDGCLISGKRVLPGAEAFVQRYAARLILVSNNSTDTTQTLAERLDVAGLAISADRIILAGETALEFARKTAPSGRILLLAGATMQRRALDMGLMPQAAAPEVIVLCRDATRGQLETAMPLLSAGIPLIVANPDLTHPGEHGPVIETGALLALLTACVPQQDMYVVGKPSAHLFQTALGPVPPGKAVMIGDNRDTDIAGARALGIKTIHLDASGAHTGIAGIASLI